MERRSFFAKGACGLLTLSAMQNLFAAGNMKELSAEKISKRAYAIFNEKKLTCGEAVMLAVCEDLGIKNDLIPDITIALSGGIGLKGRVCGAISGATVTYSMIAGSKIADRKTKCGTILSASGRIFDDFKKQYKATSCKGLTKIDFSTAEGKKLFNEKFRAGKCGAIVRLSTELLVNELKKLA